MPIVLIPGFMLDADLWSDMADDLSGYGPLIHADPASGASIEEMAVATLKTVPEEFDLIGFSMGGYIAREIQRRAPQQVRRLVLIATSARGDTEIQAQRKTAIAGTDPGHFRGVGRPSIRKSLAPDREADAALVERIHAMSLRLGGEVFHRQAAIHRDGDLEKLSALRCPTLIVAGAKDRLRSLDESREMHDAIRGSDMQIIDTGHMIPLEAPKELATAVTAFLGP